MKNLFATVKEFPKYASNWIIDLIIVILSDFHVTTLAIVGVLAGFVFHSVLIGFLVFFIFQALSRIVANVAEAIGYNLINLSTSIKQSAQITSDSIVYHANTSGQNIVKVESEG